MKKVLPLLLAFTVLLAACGPKATPTIDAASVQASAVAMAFTMAAQTLAAVPTATATIPPTETLTPQPPTATFALPTFPSILPTATQQKSSDPCNQLYPADSPGKRTTLRISNETKGSVTLSLWLNTTPLGVCGFTPGVPTLGRNSITFIEILQGCYFFSAYINDPKNPAAATTSGCINNGDLWMLYIRDGNITLKSP